MKRALTISLLALAALISCKSENTPTPNPNNGNGDKVETTTKKITFTAEINALGTLTKSAFENGEQIDVTAYNAGEIFAEDVDYNFNGEIFTSENPISYTSEQEITSLKYEALYPADSETSGTIEFPSDQRSADAFAQGELLFASITSSREQVKLKFERLTSNIEIALESDGSLGDQITFYIDAQTATKYDIEQHSASATGAISTIKPYAPTTSVASAMVAPQTIASGSDFISVNFDNGQAIYIPSSDISIKKGESLQLEAVIKDGSITINGEKIYTNTATSDGPFEVEVVEAGEYNVLIDVTPESQVENYVAAIIESGRYIGGFDSPEYFAMDVIAVMVANGVDFSQSADQKFVHSGAKQIELNDIWKVERNKDQMVFVFGVDSNGELSSGVTVVETATTKGEESGMVSGSLEVIVNYPTQYSANIDVLIEGEVGNYFLGVEGTDYFESEYGGDYNTLAEGLMKDHIDAGMSTSEAENKYFVFNIPLDDYTIAGWRFESVKEFEIVAFAISKDGDVISEVAHATTTTVAATAPSNVMSPQRPSRNYGEYPLRHSNNEYIQSILR